MLDYKALADHLKPHVLELLTELLPGGVIKGAEYQCGDNRGGPGDSLRYNIEKFTGSDFATGEVYGDILDVYRKLRGIPVQEAAEELARRYNFNNSIPIPANVQHGAAVPQCRHPKHGLPARLWKYNDTFYVARYETPEGKTFLPWIRIDGRWTAKAHPKPRPLYNIEELAKRPEDPVLVVEGEKAVEAAREFAGSVYVVTTWSGGANAWHGTDWTPLAGRRILLWADADEPGRQAVKKITTILSSLCPEIKTVDTVGQTEGWDAADAGFKTYDEFRAWAAGRTTVYNALAVAATPQAIAVAGVQVNVLAPVPDEPRVTGSKYAIWDACGLAMSQSTGQPICNLSNVVCLLEDEPAYRDNLWYDEFYQVARTRRGKKIIQLDEDYLLNLRLRIQRDYGLSRISAADVRDSVALVSRRTIKNEPRDYMDGLTWDGVSRVETFFQTYAGAPDTEYTRAVSRNFWVALCARIYQPGCIMRTMVVLRGKQWTGKSTIFHEIGGLWYTEVLESIHSNNFFQCLNGHLLLEFADLSGFVRAEINRIKQIVSCRKDTYRAPYDRLAETHPRQCVFVATTNDDDFLRDDTGNTRFWPVETGVIDLDGIHRDRDQLFAEAVSLYKSNATWHLMPETTAEQQERYRSADEWEPIIAAHCEHMLEITINEIAKNCLHIELAKFDRSTQMRVARILGILGWRKQIVWRGTSAKRIYLRPLGRNLQPESDEW